MKEQREGGSKVCCVGPLKNCHVIQIVQYGSPDIVTRRPADLHLQTQHEAYQDPPYRRTIVLPWIHRKALLDTSHRWEVLACDSSPTDHPEALGKQGRVLI